jgi:hypothetical protein
MPYVFFADLPGRKEDCKRLDYGRYACGSTHAQKTVTPDDRHVRVLSFNEIEPYKPNVGTFTPSNTGDTKKDDGDTKKDDPKKADEPKKTDDVKKADDLKKDAPADPAVAKEDAGMQYSVQPAYGKVWHQPPWWRKKPTLDGPRREYFEQITLGQTYQAHPEGERGFEYQLFEQLTTFGKFRSPSFGLGPQVTYVIPLANNKVQIGAFAQVLFGVSVPYDAVTGKNEWGQRTYLIQPAAGAQFLVAPWKFLNLGVQGSVDASFGFKGGKSSKPQDSFDEQFVFVVTVSDDIFDLFKKKKTTPK